MFSKGTKIALVPKLSTETFENGIGFPKTKQVNPNNLVNQHVPVSEDNRKLFGRLVEKVSFLRNGGLIDFLTSQVVHECVKMSGEGFET